ncbi:hypothetical protein [Ktedonobacter sp. SOSP1-85]|uniref:hypothetical protein n=1 Tax=Ktedonobacter sp. SOSP1-85 TaxID=2778367 RepID=UPI001915463C|nr:hypothetical protein [Ktedonobacter sp. SOSP1-85]
MRSMRQAPSWAHGSPSRREGGEPSRLRARATGWLALKRHPFPATGGPWRIQGRAARAAQQ